MVQPWLSTGQVYGFAINAFGPRQMVTAAHVGAEVGATVKLNDGTTRKITSITRAPLGADIVVATVDADLSSWTSVAPQALLNPTDAMFVGAGLTAGDELRDANNNLRGWYWAGSTGTLRWTQSNTRYARQPMDSYEVGFESTDGSFAMTAGDSGGGYYVQDSGGHWYLQGVGVGIMAYNGALTVGDQRVSEFRSPTGGAANCVYQTNEMLMPRSWLRSFIPGDGDADMNGTVDFADLLSLAKNYEQSASWSGGDFTGDGVTNFDDLLVLARNYKGSTVELDPILGGAGVTGTIGGTLGTSLIAPEPSLLMGLTLPLVLSRRRRRVA